MHMSAVFDRLNSIYTVNLRILEPTERGLQALKMMRTWQEMELGAPQIAEATTVENASTVFHQLCVLDRPLRTWGLLISSAKRGFKELVESLIKCHVNVNLCDSHGATAFTQAVARGHREIAKLLREAGADTNVFEPRVIGPLNLAISDGDTKELKALIQAGADVNRPIKRGLTPLMHAAGLTDDEEMVSLLIEARADLNAIDRTGSTALHYVCQSRSEKRHIIASLLCASGSALYIQNNERVTAHRLSEALGDAQMTSIICMARFVERMKQGKWDQIAPYLKHVPNMLHQRDFFKQTILIHAAMLGNSAMVRYLMALGASKDVVDNEHHTALYYAEAAGHTDVVRALQYSTYHAMMYKEEWQADALELIAKSSRPVVAPDIINSPFNEPPMQHTISKDAPCRKAGFRLLDELPLVCFQKVCTYITTSELTEVDLLHRALLAKTDAVWAGHLSDFQRSEIGALPIVEHTHVTEARAVYREMRKINLSIRSLHYFEVAVIRGCSNLVAVLARIKGIVNCCDGEGMTPLMYACNSTVLPESDAVFVKMMVSLIKGGADLNAQNHEGLCPIVHAIKQKALPRIKLLVEARASLNVVDVEEQNPLDYAISTGCSQEITTFLIRAQLGADQATTIVESDLQGVKRVREESK